MVSFLFLLSEPFLVSFPFVPRMTSSDTMVKMRTLEVRLAIRAISPFSFTLILCSRDHAGGMLLLGATHVFTRFLFVQEFECRWAGKNTAPNGPQISSTVLFCQYPGYRYLLREKGQHTKIVSLEMAEYAARSSHSPHNWIRFLHPSTLGSDTTYILASGI